MEPPPAITRFCLDGALAPRASRAHVIGVSGPQGGGKSTLTARLVAALGSAGLRAATVSIDDFYLTHAEQRDLAARHPGDRCLEHRGYPGRTTSRSATGSSGRSPRSAPDPSPSRATTSPPTAVAATALSAEVLVEAPLDVVRVEGWMLGFRALPRDACPLPLRASNDHLPAYERWHARLDAFVHLVAGDPAWIVDYRVDAERARRAAGQPALSDDEARDYIERFLPAYEAYVPPLVAAPPCARWLRVTIGPDRGIVSIVGSGSDDGGGRSAGGLKAQVAGVPSRAPWNIGGREGIRSPSATGRSISTARAHREPSGDAVESVVLRWAQLPAEASRATPLNCA